MSRGKKLLAIAIGFMVVALVLMFTMTRPALPDLPLPDPNGIDTLAKASALLHDKTGDFSDLAPADLRAVVASNSPALDLARIALTQDCRVRISYSLQNDAAFQGLIGQKHLGQAFAAGGRLAEMENRPADAVRHYASAIREGCVISRGGLMINSLVGIAVEAIGSMRMQKLVPSLDANACRSAVAELEAADALRSSVAEILTQEHNWNRRVPMGLKTRVQDWMEFREARQVEQNYAGKVATQQMRTRNLILALAARAYELEKGTKPGKPEDLVPDYLKGVPVDPTTGTNIAVVP